MDHSIYAYFLRRTQEELHSVIAMCKAELPSAHYEGILALAEKALREKHRMKREDCGE